MNASQVNRFTAAYINAALESQAEPNGNSLSQNFTAHDLDERTLDRMVRDCLTFQERCRADLESLPDPVGGGTVEDAAGRDFWDARNGLGRFSGRYPEPMAARLDREARRFGPFGLVVGEDGRLKGG